MYLVEVHSAYFDQGESALRLAPLPVVFIAMMDAIAHDAQQLRDAQDNVKWRSASKARDITSKQHEGQADFAIMRDKCQKKKKLARVAV